MRSSFTTCSKVPTKVNYKHWQRGALIPLVLISQRDGSQVFEKDIPGCKTGKYAFKNIYISKGRERMNDSNFSEEKKKTTRRKAKLGA